MLPNYDSSGQHAREQFAGSRRRRQSQTLDMGEYDAFGSILSFFNYASMSGLDFGGVNGHTLGC
ncbi:hypothetical protein LTR22_020950 [Elasticomyces elasticus]|nr:hypothetical protein LTR22_020950 [Elasticomyces elasticus]